jgi:carbon monoxide dehydrogenase subunit G
MQLEGMKEFAAPREVVWNVIDYPAQMAGLMPGVEGFELLDERRWQANVRVPLGLGGLRMTIEFERLEERAPDSYGLGARRQHRRARRLDGATSASADHQPTGCKRPRGP